MTNVTSNEGDFRINAMILLNSQQTMSKTADFILTVSFCSAHRYFLYEIVKCFQHFLLIVAFEVVRTLR